MMDTGSIPTPFVANVILSSISSLILFYIIPEFKDMFINAGLFGIDMNKVGNRHSNRENKSISQDLVKPKLPEAQGVLSGAVYLIVVFVFIPFRFPFLDHLNSEHNFPHHEFVDYLAALLSMCCMLFLGFADDVLNLKWRHKLWLPTMASLPLLMVYYINFGHTLIIVPKPFRELLGTSVDLGILYYLYMGMMAVFCTNAINILAGVNGLEAGQTLVIACSVMFFNVYQLMYGNTQTEAHLFSLYLIIPYIAVTVPLLYYNWCPARAFVGDTFCYFSGMAFAVISILGHFSKTMLLFFVPQIINFLYSAPQIFHILPCPRHRLPSVNRETGLLEMSKMKTKSSDIGRLGWVVINVLSPLGLLSVEELQEKGDKYIQFNNMTIINLAIKFCGPIYERNLSLVLLFIQVLCSVLALVIRLHVAKYFYDE
ncbi:DPAGT1 [Bugula neritina]|uniref:UDP-N-acetylglucosamine--dolichyl-phosphate N-acetylglucosaminephosphotransferase n=1 Tax=Bugula neritina TaxID=10212 RepID=A0A7J7JZR1_BUGNE|nr:DPAGT1 [Bugula neritina]